MDRRGPFVKVVIDTNVIAYFLLGTPKYVVETRTFWNHADELIAPAVWEAEIANVVWMAARTGIVSRDHSVNSRTLWHGALIRALDSGVAVYDTLFVELADRESAHLATFDQKVLKAFPAIAKRPRDIVR